MDIKQLTKHLETVVNGTAKMIKEKGLDEYDVGIDMSEAKRLAQVALHYDLPIECYGLLASRYIDSEIIDPDIKSMNIAQEFHQFYKNRKNH